MIKFRKTRVSDSINCYNKIFQKINRFLKKSKDTKFAIFSLGEVFSLFYKYTELKNTKIKYGIDDFPKKGYKLDFPVIISNEIQNHDIQKVLICVNPQYYKILKKKIDNKKHDILFPFRK